MLKPDYLLHVSEGAEEIASELHTRIIRNMVGRVLRRKDRGDGYILTAMDKWQLDTLQEAGYLLEDVQKEIAKYTGYQAKEIARAMEDAGVTALKYDDKIYEKAGIEPPPPLKQSPAMIRLMQRNYEKTLGTWENFTGTTANACHQIFIQSMDEAYMRVASGEVSYVKAYEDAIDGLCGDGLTITYPSGHTDTLETAALRCVRTGVAQSTAEIQMQRMKEHGDDLVLVSSHMGARPSHQVWQGKVYSMGQNREKYPDFVASTHYGEGNGLCGWNCRHHFSPYIEGMENPFDTYDDEENVKIYEDTQKQRAMERGIRKTKRALEGYQEAIDTLPEGDPIRTHAEEKKKALKALLREQNKAYKAFCKEHDFRELPERLRIAKAGKAGDAYNVDIIEVKPPRNPEAPPRPEPPAPEPPKAEPPKPEPIRPVTPPPAQPTASPAPAQEPQEPVVKHSVETVLDVSKWQPKENQFGTRRSTVEITQLIKDMDETALTKAITAWADSSFIRENPNMEGGYFEPATKDLVWGHSNDRDNSCRYSIFAHEIGHATDNRMDSINAGTYDIRDLFTEALVEAGGGGLLSAPERCPSHSDEFMEAMRKDIQNLASGKVKIHPDDMACITYHRNAQGISDFLDGAFGGFVPRGDTRYPGDDQNILGIKLTCGHGRNYWESKYERIMMQDRVGRVLDELKKRKMDITEDQLIGVFRDYMNATELWANINRAIVTEKENSDELDYLRLYAPNALETFRKLVRSHAQELDKYAKQGVEPKDIPRVGDDPRKYKTISKKKNNGSILSRLVNRLRSAVTR